MSEQAQLFLLERRLKEIRGYKRNALIIMIAFTVVLNLSWPYDFFSGLLIAMFLGTMVVGIVQFNYRKEEAQILGLIEQLARSLPKCSKCGKETPQGNFDFCPFCGNPFEKL